MATPVSIVTKPPAHTLIVGQAVGLHKMGRLAEAERLYSQVLAADQGHFEGQYLLGMLCAQQGRYPEALRLLGGALKAKPDALEVLHNYGRILHVLQRH